PAGGVHAARRLARLLRPEDVMSRRHAAATLACAALLLLAAGSPPSPEALMEEANAAFAGGDYVAAVALYEQAEPRAADPGRVTLGLAAAKYRLASAGPGA